MSDFIGLFKAFFYRDLAFILGGTMVILSLTYAFRCFWSLQTFSLNDLPYAAYVLFVVMAYIVGYAVQDIGGVFGVTSMAHPFEPNVLCRWLYKSFSKAEWKPVTYTEPGMRFKFENHMDRLDIPTSTLTNLERILYLKVISMCVGGCSVLSAIVLLAQWVWNRCASGQSLALGLSVILLGFGSSLICLGWVKGMQQMQFYQAIHEEQYPLAQHPAPPKNEKGAE